MNPQATARALRSLADELEAAKSSHDVLRVLVLVWNALRKCAKKLNLPAKS